MAIRKREYQKKRTVIIGSLIDNVLVRYKLFDGVFLAKVVANKDEIFGPHFGSHLIPIEYKEGRMKLRFDNDAWRHEAELCQRELLQRLSEYAPGKVKKLFFL